VERLLRRGTPPPQSEWCNERPQRSPFPTRDRESATATSMRAAVKSLVLVASAGLVLALGVASPANAAPPCWKAVINDWYDGKIDQTYPAHCYTDAIRHLPQDVRDYTSAADEIRSAMLAAIRDDRGGGSGGRGVTAYDPNNPNPNPSAVSEGNKKGVILRAIEWLGPSNAASVPLPLLILAAVAFLLLAAAGGTFVNRWLQERRLPPSPDA
jgi:hypothetical protein